MKNKIKLLFEYQRFSPNARLADVIEATENSFASLSDEELMMVAAAGESDSGQETEINKKENT